MVIFFKAQKCQYSPQKITKPLNILIKKEYRYDTVVRSFKVASFGFKTHWWPSAFVCSMVGLLSLWHNLYFHSPFYCFCYYSVVEDNTYFFTEKVLGKKIVYNAITHLYKTSYNCYVILSYFQIFLNVIIVVFWVTHNSITV